MLHAATSASTFLHQVTKRLNCCTGALGGTGAGTAADHGGAGGGRVGGGGTIIASFMNAAPGSGKPVDKSDFRKQK